MAVASGSTATFSSGVATLSERTMPGGGELKGVVTVGGVAQGNSIVQVRSGGVFSTDSFASTSTQSDGRYSISLPANTYDRVCAFIPGTATPCNTAGSGVGFNSVDSFAVLANQTNTADIAIP